MITSSKANSVTFKNLSEGNYPNKWNTLHNESKHAAKYIIKYWQKFPNDHVLRLQFTSDSATLPDLNIYIPVLNDTIAGTLVNTVIGDDTRYFYNFDITLGSDYYDKIVSFTCVQDSDILTSEPICVRDLSEDIAQGFIKYIKYSNLDRNESDLRDRWIDWSVRDFMDFFIESVNYKPNTTDDVEILNGVNSKTIISAVVYDGNQLETGAIPDYLSTKLALVADMDVFEVNSVQYIKEGEIDEPLFGNSTSIQAALNLTVKYVVGLNVDDLGITQTDTPEMSIIPKRNTAVNSGGWEVDTPEGYMLHSIWITHAATSTSSTAIVTCGTTLAGTDLIDSVQGEVIKSTYNFASKKWKPYSRHFLKDPDATSKVYFSVSGAGAVMQIIINFDTVTES